MYGSDILHLYNRFPIVKQQIRVCVCSLHSILSELAWINQMHWYLNLKFFPISWPWGLLESLTILTYVIFSLLDYLMKFFDFKVIKYQGRKGALIHQLGR